MNKVLELTHIRRVYEQGGKSLEVLKNVNLVIGEGETVALVGPSGSGKTTLLQIAGLLDSPTSGEITVAGEAMAKANDHRRTERRKASLGFVYQFHHLLPEFSALENVLLPQLIAGTSKVAAAKRAETLLAEVGLAERLHHRPAKLSGGEQQRVAIARALANKPALLLADEPTGNLDPDTSEQVFQVLKQAVSSEKLALLIVTHNMDLAKRMDRVLRLEKGEIISG